MTAQPTSAQSTTTQATAVVTRFAPSPTGELHIGGARTALFNWLFAQHHGGRFRLRIEDTDRKRSTEAAIQAILKGLSWLDLEWDGEVVYQSSRAERHGKVARRLLAMGKAYHCYCSREALREMRDAARAEGRSPTYDGRCRARDPASASRGDAPVIRFKAPRQGETEIDDLVQGRVSVANDQLDDMVLLRADGTPTYMLSVVVDDQDMSITQVIRGDDHLTNAFRQTQLYRALDWQVPAFAHIPLIHGADGAKLSKRHGALGVEAYREMGYLPEALRNYLLRLGWAHGDDEIISTEQAISWFDLDGVGRAPSRFDFARLDSLNGHYIRQAEAGRLCDLVVARLEPRLGRVLQPAQKERLLQAMPSLMLRPKTICELSDNAAFYVAERPLELTEKAAKLLGPEARAGLGRLVEILAGLDEWRGQILEERVRDFAATEGLKLGAIAQPLRAALTGALTSPGIFEVMEILGRAESLARIADRLGRE